MKTTTFKTINGLELIIKNRKSAVIFEINKTQVNKNYKFDFQFSKEVLSDLLEYIETIAVKSWGSLEPKESDSMGTDYYEYFDKELDNNGYLSIRNNSLFIERPSLESEKLYQFNKKKMESFIFDLRKIFVNV